MKYDNLSAAIGLSRLLRPYDRDEVFDSSHLSLGTMASVVEAFRVLSEYEEGTPGIVAGVRYEGTMLMRDSTNISISAGLYMDWELQINDNLDMVFKEVRVAGRFDTIKPLLEDPALARFANHETGCLVFKEVPAGLIVDPTRLLTGYADCLAAMMFNNDNIDEVERALGVMEFSIPQAIEVAISGVMHCTIFPDDSLRLDDCPESYDYIKVFAVMAAMSQKIYSMNIVRDIDSGLFAVEPL